nr:hypothetical protein [Tanacetum cinerariifolium]
MITEAMKKMEHYKMYAEVFGIDVPLIQSQPIESTQGTDRTPRAPRSIRLTPPAPVLIVEKADELILQDTLQVSLAEHKSRQKQEARENVALVDEHLTSVEIENMVEVQENVADDSSIPRNDEHNILGTRLEPKSDKESPEVGITDVILHVNVYDEEEEEDEITDEVYELKQSEKGKNLEESRIIAFPAPIRSPRIHTNLVSSDTEELQELTKTHTTPSSSSPSTKLSHTNRLLSLFKAKPARFKPQKSFGTLANHLHDAMAKSLPIMVDTHVKEQVEQQVPDPKFHPVAHLIINPLKHDIPLQPRWEKDPRKLWCCSGFICMQTRSSSRLVSNPSSNPTPSTNPNPKGRNRRRSKQRCENFNLEELSPPIVTMADQRTMAQLLQAPTEGYEDAI